jgi:diaminopimelate epimerase
MRFAKGHGTENDFVILPDPDGDIDLSAGLAARLCDRRTGLGADGVLRAVRVAAAVSGVGSGLTGVSGSDSGVSGSDSGVSGSDSGVSGSDSGVSGSDSGVSRRGSGPDAALSVLDPDAAAARAGAEWFMDYRNADGSPAEMCGNGIRVFARYLLGHGLVAGPEFAVATRGGTRLVRMEPDGQITVDMGPPLVLGAGHAALAGQRLDGLRVSVGNPHLACLVGTPLPAFDLSRPPALDAAEFPDGANLELVSVVGRAHIQMRVYERGSGATRSCGTGAVAAAAAAAVATAVPALGGDAAAVLPPAGIWIVDLPGGRLRVTFDGHTGFLSGPAVIVAEGELDESWLSGSPVIAAQSLPAP